DLWNLPALLGPHDEIRMRHLQIAVVALQPAAGDTRFVYGELFFEIVALCVEEQEIEKPRAVRAAPLDLVGQAGSFRREMRLDDDLHRGDHSFLRFDKAGGITPVEEARRQHPEQVGDARPRYLLEQLHE